MSGPAYIRIIKQMLVTDAYPLLLFRLPCSSLVRDTHFLCFYPRPQLPSPVSFFILGQFPIFSIATRSAASQHITHLTSYNRKITQHLPHPQRLLTSTPHFDMFKLNISPLNCHIHKLPPS